MSLPRAWQRGALAALGLALAGCGGEDSPAHPPVSLPPDFVAGFGFDEPLHAPVGDPIDVPRPARGVARRAVGRFSYVQRAEGRFAEGVSIPARRLEGSLDVVARPQGEGAGRVVEVEGTVEVTERSDGGPPRTTKGPVHLRFLEQARGGSERKDVVLKAPAEVRDALENVLALWTAPPPLPVRPFRVGEAFGLAEAVDVEPVQRSLWYAFLRRDRSLPQVTAPIGGAAWVSRREPSGGEDAILVHERMRTSVVAPLDAGETSGRALGFGAALDRDRRISVATGATLSYEATWRTVTRYVDPRSDYRVDVEQRATLTTSPAD